MIRVPAAISQRSAQQGVTNMIWKSSGVLLLAVALFMTCAAVAFAEPMIDDLKTVTSDDVTIYGEAWIDGIGTAAP